MSYTSANTTCSVAPRSPNQTLASRFMAALDVWRSRHHLSTLEPHILDDLGISAKQAQKEANRPIWDVPAHWVK